MCVFGVGWLEGQVSAVLDGREGHVTTKVEVFRNWRSATPYLAGGWGSDESGGSECLNSEMVQDLS